MKKTVSRLGSAALCVTLSLALGCGCAVMPPASSEKPASSAVSVPTDAEGKPLYDATRLDDGHLRILYGYDNSGDSRTVLCGSKVLYQSARSENVSLLQDIVTGETNYWFRTWSDSTGRGGRRSALYDKDGNEVMAFDGEQSAAIQNGLLVLQESRMVGDSYNVDYDSYGTCSVIDLATGKNLPVPEGAYSCIVCGDMLVFTCYARPADLAENEWDDDSNLHSWVAIQQKDGTQTYGSASSTAYRISYASDELDNWVELDISHADGSPADQVLHNPATGEGYIGFQQTCGSGTAAFLTANGTYQLRDLTTEDRGVIAEFDALPSNYFPGYVVTWNVDSDYRYSLHDLSTGEVTPLYAVSLAGNRIVLYAQDGSLKVYDTDTGALLTDVNAGTIGDDQRVTLDCEEDGFVWMELRDADSYEIAAIRVYGPEGLVSDLSSLNETYNYLGYLTTDANGRPLFTHIRSYTDTADTGADYLCSIIYGEYNHEAYVLDIYYTKDPMEITEPETARRLLAHGVNLAKIESNNGGRGFARNVQEQLKRLGSNRCRVEWFHQSENKVARILTNSTWVQDHIYYPVNWRDRWPEYAKAMLYYQKEGKNAHDDAPDATTGVAEQFTRKGGVSVW